MASRTATRRKSGPPRSADSRLEQKLADLGLVADHMLEIGLHQFDEEGSLHNQARLGEPIDLAHVAMLATKIEDGGDVPAILAHERNPGDPLLVVDGNHRLQATKKARRDAIDAYVVRGNEPSTRRAVELLMYQLNAEHGKATTIEERVHHALNLYDRGVSLKDAAKAVSAPYAKVLVASALQEAGQRADRMGVSRSRFDKLPPSQRKRLNQLRTDEVFGAMAKLTIDAGLSAEDFTNIMAELTDISSFDAQMTYITTARQAYGTQIQTGKADGEGHGRQRMSPRKSAILTLGRIENLSPPQEIMERLTPDDKLDLKHRTKSALERLTALYEALDA